MTFASVEFAALLAIVFALYYPLPRRGRMLLLLSASYLFYCYWKPLYALLIFASTVLDYVVALRIPRTRSRAGRRAALGASIAGNLGMLGYFKYTNFALDSLRDLLGPLGQNLPGPLEIILPVGISFYTFQTMSYTIDVYRGDQEPERDFVLVALYVAFFPQLVAGPIERARSLMPQLAALQPFCFRNLEEGSRLMLWGLIKKTVFGDRLISAAYPAFLDPGAYSTGELAFAAAAGVVMIYLDFSAYSDIAKGTAQLFGVKLVQNFRYPHAAGNVAEFWRRWHVSMSTFVRDYLHRPLGGFRPRSVWFDGRTTLITMGVVGLWHGAAWTFVLWGLLHGLSLVVYRIWRLYVLRRFKGRPFLKSFGWRFGSWATTCFIRIAINILFFAPTIQAAGVFYRRLYLEPTLEGFDRGYVWIGLGVIYVFWIFHYLQSTRELGRWVDGWHPALRGASYTALFYLLLFGGVDQAEQFIYFQF
jgi:alginate O-acetyltransferase complex protein AlgI